MHLLFGMKKLNCLICTLLLVILQLPKIKTQSLFIFNIWKECDMISVGTKLFYLKSISYLYVHLWFSKATARIFMGTAPVFHCLTFVHSACPNSIVYQKGLLDKYLAHSSIWSRYVNSRWPACDRTVTFTNGCHPFINSFNWAGSLIWFSSPSAWFP